MTSPARLAADNAAIEQVRALFDYRDDGRLYWRVDRGKARKGALAGNASHSRRGKYWSIQFNGRQIPRARLVWAWHHGAFPGSQVWHLNHDSTDDRIENLSLTFPGHNR